MDKLRVVLVDGNDLDMRMRLKHSINATHEFGECIHVGTTTQALSLVETTPLDIDLVFLSYHVSPSAIREFAEAARTYEHAEDCALVMILPAGTTRESTLAESMLAGIDGFLLEPFSTDNLVKVTKLAGRVSRDKSSAREQAALKVLVRDQIRLLDAMYCLFRGNISTEQTLEKLRGLGTRVSALSASSLDMYHSLLIDYSERSMVPIAIPKNPYAGRSERAKRRVDQMLISNLECPKERLDPKKEVKVGSKVMKLPPLPSRGE